ncbi:MAG: flavin reductase family protein [Nitriliruptoraceae bacterium]
MITTDDAGATVHPDPTREAATIDATERSFDTAGVDPMAFRAVMGSFLTGVSVMTTHVEGVPHGMTASAIASVSLEPPLVLVCVERTTLMADRVQEAGVFALSFLAEDQAELSNRFAVGDREEGESEFAGLTTHTAVTGARLLEGATGTLDCRVYSITDGGDHLVVIGEVVAAEVGRDAPLAYYRGGYGVFRSR